MIFLLETQGLIFSQYTKHSFLDGELNNLERSSIATADRNSKNVKELRKAYARWYLDVGQFKKIFAEFGANWCMKRSNGRALCRGCSRGVIIYLLLFSLSNIAERRVQPYVYVIV